MSGAARAADQPVEYGEHAGKSAPAAADKDHFGNAQGDEYDLGRDGAFAGHSVAVLQHYTMENFDFKLPQAVLERKGFAVHRWTDQPPAPHDLAHVLEGASQLWVISGSQRRLTDQHLAVIKDFFDRGHGVYIWGDNDPYTADANAVAGHLLGGARLTGNHHGDQVVGAQTGGEDKPGLFTDHELTTGIERLYEGITVSTIHPGPKSQLWSILHGSAGNMITAYHDEGGKRAILDGGFTRLYHKWDTAGTARMVGNAAAWLAHPERFGLKKTGRVK